ncbi:hypothetical protein ACXAUS_002055 [Clostridium sporogenes]|nr:hypothetical protein [Clostridium botulinum]
MNRWGVYETLKGNKEINIREIQQTSAEEIEEGLIEFLIVKEKQIEN